MNIEEMDEKHKEQFFNILSEVNRENICSIYAEYDFKLAHMSQRDKDLEYWKLVQNVCESLKTLMFEFYMNDNKWFYEKSETSEMYSWHRYL